METQLSNFTSQENIAAEQARFMTKVYGWMSLALLTSAAFAVFIASSPSLIQAIFGNRVLFWILIIAQFGAVIALSAAIQKMSTMVATMVFLGYSALTGITLSSIFLIYTAGSIASTFVITALTFGAMSAYGYFTKRDLTTIGNMAMMGLIGIVIASLFNIFFQNETVYWVTTYLGVLIFVGLTAYDTQKIKNMNIIGNEGTDEDRKEAIMGALTLYLDFINLFLMLLRLFGDRRK